MVIMKFICQLASPWGNFYFFYWKHKVYFKTAQAARLSIGIFYDARSELNDNEENWKFYNLAVILNISHIFCDIFIYIVFMYFYVWARESLALFLIFNNYKKNSKKKKE